MNSQPFFHQDDGLSGQFDHLDEVTIPLHERPLTPVTDGPVFALEADLGWQVYSVPKSCTCCRKRHVKCDIFTNGGPCSRCHTRQETCECLGWQFACNAPATEIYRSVLPGKPCPMSSPPGRISVTPVDLRAVDEKLRRLQKMQAQKKEIRPVAVPWATAPNKDVHYDLQPGFGDYLKPMHEQRPHNSFPPHPPSNLFNSSRRSHPSSPSPFSLHPTYQDFSHVYNYAPQGASNPTMPPSATQNIHPANISGPRYRSTRLDSSRQPQVGRRSVSPPEALPPILSGPSAFVSRKPTLPPLRSVIGRRASVTLDTNLPQRIHSSPYPLPRRQAGSLRASPGAYRPSADDETWSHVMPSTSQHQSSPNFRPSSLLASPSPSSASWISLSPPEISHGLPLSRSSSVSGSGYGFDVESEDSRGRAEYRIVTASATGFPMDRRNRGAPQRNWVLRR